jgi:hypothetical protein
MWQCQNQSQNKNKIQTQPASGGTTGQTVDSTENYWEPYMCKTTEYKYTSCEKNYYLSNCEDGSLRTLSDDNTVIIDVNEITAPNSCKPCPSGKCDGGTTCPITPTCEPGKYLSDCADVNKVSKDENGENYIALKDMSIGNQCIACSNGQSCAGGAKCPTGAVDCGDYIGSLYQKVVSYAIQ